MAPNLAIEKKTNPISKYGKYDQSNLTLYQPLYLMVKVELKKELSFMESNDHAKDL